MLSAARCIRHNPSGPLQAHRRDLAVQSPAVLSTLFADYYAAGEHRGVNVLACEWQSALLANPRSDIQCTAL
jgi:hypothetical protein